MIDIQEKLVVKVGILRWLPGHQAPGPHTFSGILPTQTTEALLPKVGNKRHAQLCCQITYSTTQLLSFSTADVWGLVFCVMGGVFPRQGRTATRILHLTQ